MLEHMRRKDHKGRFVPFSVKMVRCDRTSKSGGEWLELNDVTLPKQEVKKISKQLPASGATENKNPNHRHNGTINFMLPNGQIRKGHIRLITRFNGMKVI